MQTEDTTKRRCRCCPTQHQITDDHNGGCVCACALVCMPVTVTMHVFERLQRVLLPLHLSHYSWSFEAYSHFGRDFIRSVLFFFSFDFHSMLCVCLRRGRTHACYTCLIYVFFFTSSYPHSIYFAVFLSVHPAAWLIRPLTLNKSIPLVLC